MKAGAASAKAGVTVYPMWFVESVSDKLVPDGSTYELDKNKKNSFFFSKQKFSATRKVLIHNGILPKGDFTVTSSNNSVATVKKESFQTASLVYNGFSVSALNVGSSTITVKIGNVSRSFKVTVTEKTVPATGLTLAPKSLELVEGQTKSIRATVTPSNSTDNVVWPGSSFLTSNGGGSYTAKQYDGGTSIGFGLDVRAGSVKATANVIVYQMQFYTYKKNKFELIPNESRIILKKNESITCYFSKHEFPTISYGIIGKDILRAGDFTVISSEDSVATVRKETLGGEFNGFSVSALSTGLSRINVKIGNVYRAFEVLVTK